MCEFFKGWRRKCGCAVLLLATLICAAWGASTQLCILVDHDVGDWQYHAHSYNGEFGLWRYKPNDWPRNQGCEWYTSWGNHKLWRFIRTSLNAEREVCSRRFVGCGFSKQLSENEIGATDFAELTVPYWQPILPLTLLSTYLVLWKPRKRAEPDHA